MKFEKKAAPSSHQTPGSNELTFFSSLNSLRAVAISLSSIISSLMRFDRSRASISLQSPEQVRQSKLSRKQWGL